MADKQSEEILEGKGPQTKKLMLVIIIISAVFMGVMGAGFYILWSKVAPPDPEVNLEYETIKKEAGRRPKGGGGATRLRGLPGPGNVCQMYLYPIIFKRISILRYHEGI